MDLIAEKYKHGLLLTIKSEEARIWIINYVVKNSKWTDGKLIVPKESVEHFWFSAFDNELEVKQINNS